MTLTKLTTKWYAGGLRFECTQCGRCCSGPNEGDIWVSRDEIGRIAEFLNLSPRQCRRQFLRRVGWRTTIIEDAATKDCIFLRTEGGRRGCAIYPVRPSQCREWPFWPDNLAGPGAWDKAAQRCPGINRGPTYSLEQIEQIRRNKKWWASAD